MIYQPQAESWNKDRLEGRAAVKLEDIKLTAANFPSEAAQQSRVSEEVRLTVPQWPRTLSVAKLRADLAIEDVEKSRTRCRSSPTFAASGCRAAQRRGS